jgi:hypothetical protein
MAISVSALLAASQRSLPMGRCRGERERGQNGGEKEKVSFGSFFFSFSTFKN